MISKVNWRRPKKSEYRPYSPHQYTCLDNPVHHNCNIRLTFYKLNLILVWVREPIINNPKISASLRLENWIKLMHTKLEAGSFGERCEWRYAVNFLASPWSDGMFFCQSGLITRNISPTVHSDNLRLFLRTIHFRDSFLGQAASTSRGHGLSTSYISHLQHRLPIGWMETSW